MDEEMPKAIDYSNGTKACTKCKLVLPLDNFYKQNYESKNKGIRKRAYPITGDRLTPWCKGCTDNKNRKWDSSNPEKRLQYSRRYERTRESRRGEYLKRLYGITLEDYDRLFSDQDGKCAICGRPEEQILRGSKRAIGVDHDHNTGAVRALLCDDCNTGLARFKENPELLRDAALYIEKYSA